MFFVDCCLVIDSMWRYDGKRSMQVGTEFEWLTGQGFGETAVTFSRADNRCTGLERAKAGNRVLYRMSRNKPVTFVERGSAWEDAVLRPGKMPVRGNTACWKWSL